MLCYIPNMFKVIKEELIGDTSWDTSFPISVFYKERYFLKQSSLFPYPLLFLWRWHDLPPWKFGRGSRLPEVQLLPQPCLYGSTCRDHGFWLLSNSQWPGLEHEADFSGPQPVTLVPCLRMNTACFGISCSGNKRETGVGIFPLPYPLLFFLKNLFCHCDYYHYYCKIHGQQDLSFLCTIL